MSEVELDSPPNGEVLWLAARTDEKATCVVKSQTWHRAREKAAIALKCDPQTVSVERMPSGHI